MAHLRKSMAAGLMLVLSAAATHAQSQAAAERVKVELLADVQAVQPGIPFRLGVKLTLAPSWHVYWKNPGDSGQSVTATFDLPPGFTVSELAYPVPKKFTQPGDLIAYGYADEVMFVATITPPRDLPTTSPVPVTAKVKYLVCDENACLPGKADASLSLPVSADPRPANLEHFNRWFQRIPASADQAKNIAEAKIDGKLDAGSGHYVVDVAWQREAQDVEFFPGKSATISVSDIEVSSSGPRRTRITFDARLLAGQQPDVEALDSVVAYTDAHGARRGIELPVPVKPQARQQQ